MFDKALACCETVAAIFTPEFPGLIRVELEQLVRYLGLIVLAVEYLAKEGLPLVESRRGALKVGPTLPES